MGPKVNSNGIFQVYFEVKLRGIIFANTYIQYEEGTEEEEIKKDYDEFVKEVMENIKSEWSYEQ